MFNQQIYPNRANKANKVMGNGYQKEAVNVSQLFRSGLTMEPSENALRKRAAGGILAFIQSEGNEYKYDKMLSVIRVNAARRSKRPGVTWRDIREAMTDSRFGQETLIKALEAGSSTSDVEDRIAGDLAELLQIRKGG